MGSAERNGRPDRGSSRASFDRRLPTALPQQSGYPMARRSVNRPEPTLAECMPRLCARQRGQPTVCPKCTPRVRATRLHARNACTECVPGARAPSACPECRAPKVLRVHCRDAGLGCGPRVCAPRWSALQKYSFYDPQRQAQHLTPKRQTQGLLFRCIDRVEVAHQVLVLEHRLPYIIRRAEHAHLRGGLGLAPERRKRHLPDQVLLCAFGSCRSRGTLHPMGGLHWRHARRSRGSKSNNERAALDTLGGKGAFELGIVGAELLKLSPSRREHFNASIDPARFLNIIKSSTIPKERAGN